jgi:hypothetical protein
MVGRDGRPIRVPDRVLAGLVAAALAVALTSVLVAQHNAQRDESIALLQLADVQTLLASPPAPAGTLQQQLTQAKSELATLQAAGAKPSVDPASDAAATLLVVHSQAAGLAVKGITRPNPSTAKFDSGTYQVDGVNITVEGTTAQIIAFLEDMHKTEPALFAALGTMSIGANGTAHADVVFSAYTKDSSPTPAALAAATPAVKP